MVFVRERNRVGKLNQELGRQAFDNSCDVYKEA